MDTLQGSGQAAQDDAEGRMCTTHLQLAVKYLSCLQNVLAAVCCVIWGILEIASASQLPISTASLCRSHTRF